jgi:hypothetical protein
MYNIVFYSRRCNLCIDLLNILKNEKMIDYFKLVCVDDDLERCPVKMVPTMIIKGINKPLQGKETVQWVTQTKFITQKRIADMQKTLVQHNMMKMMMQNKNSGPIGFSQELTGFSDQFAYTTVDQPVPHAFVGYKDYEKNHIFTAKEVGKLKDKEMKQIIATTEKTRKEEEIQNKELMEKRQLMELIKHERNMN